MKRKLISVLFAGVAVLALSGCGGGSGGDYYIDPIVEPIDLPELRYHLIDQDGFGVADIEYTCDGVYYDFTDGSGGFYFYPNDDCSFTLDLTVDSGYDDLFIEDDFGYGVADVYYECSSGEFGYTDLNGHFFYDNVYEDDICLFEL